jgi:hypothetical protein
MQLSGSVVRMRVLLVEENLGSSIRLAGFGFRVRVKLQISLERSYLFLGDFN